MNNRRKTHDALARHREGMLRYGATSPGEAPQIEQALAEDLKHGPGQEHVKRQIPENYKYDPKSLKPMAKMLWAMSVSLGHALAAHKQFVRLKSSTISPDGMLGGRGYVMAIKDVRTMLHDACEALSALCDTVHDEINAPHWEPKLGQLEKKDVETIESLMGEAQRFLQDPEGEAEEDEEEAEEDGHAEWHHPAVDKANKGKKDPKSGLPEGGSKESNPQAEPLRHDMRKSPNPQNEKHASARRANSSLPVETMPGGPRVDHLDRADNDQTGPNGTYNEESLPGGDALPGGGNNWHPNEGTREYDYPSDGDNDLREKSAALLARLRSALDQTGTAAFPDGNMDHTRTEGWDFGIGDGNGDQASGQGAGGYGEGNPGAPDSNPGGGTGNKGVYGPQSGLPKDPGGQVKPSEGDSNLTIENEIGGKGRSARLTHDRYLMPTGVYIANEDPWAAHDALPGTVPFGANDFQEATRENSPGGTREAASGKFGWYDGVYDYEHPVEPVGSIGPQEPTVGADEWYAGAELPGDADPGVARSDYYDGPKPDNMQNTAPSTVGQTRLPGEQMPAKDTPTKMRPSHAYEHMFATGELPGDGTSFTYDYDKDLGPDKTDRVEQPNTPYVKWDDNTHEMRPDPVHQRDDQGPYVHNDLTERPSNG